MKIVVPVKKETIGSCTLLGALYTKLIEDGLESYQKKLLEKEKIVQFVYDTTSYSFYPYPSPGINARTLAETDIEELKNLGWLVEELNP